MANNSQVKYCDQLADHVAQIIKRSPKKVIDLARQSFASAGKGCVVIAFDKASDAQDMITNFKKRIVVRLPIIFVPIKRIPEIGCEQLVEMVNAYDPKFECVAYISVSWSGEQNETSPNENSSAMPLILSILTPEEIFNDNTALHDSR